MSGATNLRRSARQQAVGIPTKAVAITAQHAPARKRPRKGGKLPLDDSAVPSTHSDAKPSPKPGKKHGALAALPTMPLDVLYEIFRHVRPLDLVNLSRTTKSLRAVLLDRSAAWMWKEAMDSFAGMPSPLPSMTEPQYLALMLDPRCFYCNSSNVHIVHWALRRRCCKPCFRSSKNFIPSYALDKMLSKKLIAQAEPLLAAFRGISKDFKGTYYLVSEVKEVMRALTTLSNKPEAMQTFKDKRAAAIQMYAQRSQGIDPWVDWHMMSRSNHKDDLTKLHEERIKAITQRLAGFGWGQEFQLMGHQERMSFRNYKHVKILKPLTDKVWDNIKDDMVEVMSELKELRIERMTLEAARKRLAKARPALKAAEAKRHWCSPSPNDADLFLMPEFSDIFARPVLDDGADSVTQEEIDTALAPLPEILESWVARNRQYLADLLPKSNTKPRGKRVATEEPSRIDLANSFFTCSTCESRGFNGMIFHSSTILFHRDWFHSASRVVGHSLQTIGKILHQLPWNYDSTIVYDEQMSANASDIVTLCGLNPNTATLADMDWLNKRLVCTGCPPVVTSEKETKRRAFGWKEAVGHADRCKKHDFLVLDDEKTKDLLVIEYNDKSPRWNKNWRCKHCPNSPKRTFEDTVAHLRDCHTVEQHSITDDDLTDPALDVFISYPRGTLVPWD